MASNMSRVLSAAAWRVSVTKLALPGAGSSSAIRLFSSPPTDPPQESPSKEPKDGGGVKVTESKDSQWESDDDDVGESVNEKTGEIGGPRGPEPTRYGDWEQKGRCSDF